MRETHDDERPSQLAAIAECLHESLPGDQFQRDRHEERGETNKGEKHRQGSTRPPSSSREVDDEYRRQRVHDDPYTDLGPDVWTDQTFAGSVHDREDRFDDTGCDGDRPGGGSSAHVRRSNHGTESMHHVPSDPLVPAPLLRWDYPHRRGFASQSRRLGPCGSVRAPSAGTASLRAWGAGGGPSRGRRGRRDRRPRAAA